MTFWPFKVVNKDGKPVIRVEYQYNEKDFTPEEISSMILLKMKETAEAYLGEDVSDAGTSSRAFARRLCSLTLHLASHHGSGLLQRRPASGDQGRWSYLGPQRAPHHQRAHRGCHRLRSASPAQLCRAQG